MLCPVIVPCGPGPLEFNRLISLIFALGKLEENPWIVVVNDANPHVNHYSIQSASPETRKVNLDIIPNPRQGRGWGWSGGLVLGELAALRFIYEKDKRIPFIIKCDTDALPISPFSARLAPLFENPNIGLIGSRVIDETPGPDRTTPPIGYFRNKIHKMCALLSMWRKPCWHIRSPIWDKRTRKLRALILQSIKNGYTPGELVEGGALAFSPRLVQAICESNLDREKEMILHLCVSDDLFITLLSYIYRLNAIHSDIFCIEPFALRYPPEKLRKQCPQAAWIHSLKGRTPEYEQAARNFFQKS